MCIRDSDGADEERPIKLRAAQRREAIEQAVEQGAALSLIHILDTLADIEAASYPPAEGASRQSIAGRVAVYPDCFWLLDEGGEVKAFVNGFVTDMPDLTDEMYDGLSLNFSHDSSLFINTFFIVPYSFYYDIKTSILI